MAEPHPISAQTPLKFPKLFQVERPDQIASFVRETPRRYDAVLEAPKAFESAAGEPPERISLEITPDPEGDTTLTLMFDFEGSPEEGADLTWEINKNWTVNLPQEVGRRLSLGLHFK